MTNSRAKGHAAERELFHILSRELGLKVERNLVQSRDGGCDTCVGDFAIECKRAETLLLNDWWSQAVDQANRAGRRPMLVYRRSRHPWRVRVYGLDYVRYMTIGGIPDGYLINKDIIELDLDGGINLIRLTLPVDLPVDKSGVSNFTGGFI